MMTVVPFHIGKRKSVVRTETRTFDPKYRIKVALAGAVAAGLGFYQIRLANVNSRAAAMLAFSAAQCAFGVTLVLIALTPMAWINKTFEWLMSRSPRRHAK